MAKGSLALDDQQQRDLQIVLADRDELAALRFPKEVVWAEVQAVQR